MRNEPHQNARKRHIFGKYSSTKSGKEENYRLFGISRRLSYRTKRARFRSTGLRHSAVTMLKAAGVSDFMAREIVGHESAAVSRQYTHPTTDDKRAAIQRFDRPLRE